MNFIKNLIAFIAGLACQVLAGLFPDLAAILAPAGSLLLGAANIAKVLNGSLWKHATVFGLGLLCQIAAVKAAFLISRFHGSPASVPSVAGALLAAGGLLGSAADLGRILAGIRTPVGTPDSPAPPVPPKP